MINKVELFPSLIAADLLELGTDIARLDPYVDGYHLDVMDFHFVQNLTFGPDTVNAIRRATNKLLMVHLMVDYPERYFDRLKLHKGDILSIHPESPSELPLDILISAIAVQGMTPSIALNPETPIALIKAINVPLNHLLLMSVHPGFSGQAFMPMVYDKIEEALKIAKQSNTHYTIALDGGVNQDNAHKIVNAGVQQLIIGSALFSTHDPAKAAQELSASLLE